MPLLEEVPHAHEVPERPEYPDVYVNGEVGTVTIDPIKNSAWILNADDRHPHSVHRGALKDHAAVMRTLSLLKQVPPPEHNVMPTTAEINKLQLFTPHCVANSTRGNMRIGRTGRVGELPTITKLLYENKLPDPLDWQIDAQVQLERRSVLNRAFDCSGPCR
jgi:hypothetical protein